MFEWLKRIINIPSSNDIICLNNLIQVPDRSYYANDKDKISLINEYKADYIQLFNNKIGLSQDLNIKRLQNDMNMSVDLLLYNFITNDELTRYSQEELLILTTKFKLYLKDINSIETETTLRIIALKELLSRRLSHKNKMMIIEEINMLSNTLIIFHGQRQAITREIDSILKIMELDKFSIDYDLIKEKYNKVFELTNGVVAVEDYQKIDNMILKIAVIEKDLESYVYKHKKDIRKYIFELDEIDNIEKSVHNKKYLYDRILEVENRILLFKEYGNNIVSEEVLKKLYRIKFDIMVSDINYQMESPIQESDGGIEYYKDIIFNMMQEIIKGNNLEFNKTFSSDIEKAYSIMRDYYTSDRGRYNLDEILSDKFMLSLLLCFDQENGFHKLLNESKVRTNIPSYERNRYEKGINRNHLKWEELIPLKSVFMLYDCSDDWLYDLYDLTIDKNDETYYLPEGLVAIDFDKYAYQSDFHDSTKRLLKNENKTKIVLPSTLKIITGDYLDNHFTEIYLNDGLEVIGDNVFHGFVGDNISIPDSVRKIGRYAFGEKYRVDSKRIQTITFESIDSYLLNHQERLKEFLDDLTLVYDSTIGYCYGYRTELGRAIFKKHFENKMLPLFDNLVIKDIGLTISKDDLAIPFQMQQLNNHHYIVQDSNYYDELLMEKNNDGFQITRCDNDGVMINCTSYVDGLKSFIHYRKDYESYLVDEMIERIIQKVITELNYQMIYHSDSSDEALVRTKNKNSIFR